MYYHFTSDCRIGIPQIDAEHKKLFDLINNAFMMLEKSPVTLSDLNELADELNDYAKVHFEHEEAYMREHDDPEYNQQKRQHDAFKEKISCMYADFQGMTEELALHAASELLTFLAKWLYGHIMSSDMMIGKLAPLQEAIDEYQEISHTGEKKERSFVKFTDDYRTGIAFVDREHAKLFEIVDRCYDTVMDEDFYDKYDEIMTILAELRDYTEQHFAEEEEYMERIQYEGLEAQRRAHEAFVDRLREVNPYDVDDNQKEYLFETIEFLLGWLQNHIMMSDKMIPVVAGAETE